MTPHGSSASAFERLRFLQLAVKSRQTTPMHGLKSQANNGACKLCLPHCRRPLPKIETPPEWKLAKFIVGIPNAQLFQVQRNNRLRTVN